MTTEGNAKVPHINQYLLDETAHAPGAVLVSCLEGSRPLLLEIQALVILQNLVFLNVSLQD